MWTAIFIYSFICHSALVENPCGTMTPRGITEDWGIGTYFISDDFEIFVYSDTAGTLFGRLKVSESHLHLYDFHNRRINFQQGDIDWIGHYSHEFLKVRESVSKKYVEIFWEANGGLFINKNEADLQKLELLTYKSLLFDKTIFKELNGYTPDEIGIGVNLIRTCLNLRSGPSIDSSVIYCINGNEDSQGGTTHLKILDNSGNWAKVEVTTRVFQDGDVDCPSRIIRRITGWVKAIADNGFPNIWYAVSSY